MVVETIVAALIPVLRSVAGWAHKALEDGKIDMFEWKRLAATVIRVGGIAVMGHLGLNGAGVDIDAISAAAGAFVVDFILSEMRK